MTSIYKINLRAADGQERRELEWLPSKAARCDLCLRARRNVMEMKIKEV